MKKRASLILACSLVGTNLIEVSSLKAADLQSPTESTTYTTTTTTTNGNISAQPLDGNAIKTKDELIAFLKDDNNLSCEGKKTIGVKDENVWKTVTVTGSGKLTFLTDFTIPEGVKLQIVATNKEIDVDATITVAGCITDGRAAADRANGLVGNGEGKIVINKGGSYYLGKVTKPITTKTNDMYLKMGPNSTITILKGGHLEITSGTVTIAHPIDTTFFKKVSVGKTGTIVNDKNIGADIEYIKDDREFNKKLESSIRVAQKNRDSVSTNEDIASNKLWVDEESMSAYVEAISKIEELAKQEDLTEQQCTEAIGALNEASYLFNCAKQLGKGEQIKQEKYEEVLATLNALSEDCATHTGKETYAGVTNDVIRINKPVTINGVITIPAHVKLQVASDITINGRIIVEGTLQDTYLSAQGLIGAEGIGDIVFKPNALMYVKDKGEVIGNTTGMSVCPDSEIMLVNGGALVLTKGMLDIKGSIYSGIASSIYCLDHTKINVSGGITGTTTIYADRKNVEYTNNGIHNTEDSIGIIATKVVSDAPEIVSAEIKDETILLKVLSKGKHNVVVTLADAKGTEATVELTVDKGAIVSALIKAPGYMTPAQYDELINKKKAELEDLIKKAEEQSLDAEREKGVVWFADYFMKCVEWDEANLHEIKRLYAMSPVYKTQADKLAERHAEYERKQIITILDKGIDDLHKVLNGELVRPEVVHVQWDKLQIKGDQFCNPDGTPVYLYDYFSKAQNGDQADKNLYNNYLGKVVHPLSTSLNFLKDEEGNLSDRAIQEGIGFYDYYDFDTQNAGYSYLWHSGTVLPQWAKDKYGKEELEKGIPKYTSYDIDNPHIREMWEMVFDNYISQVAGSKGSQLGYLLTNEPHWFTDTDNPWFVIKNGVSDYTMDKFKAWLKDNYNNDINKLNTLWGKDFASFEAVELQVPMKIADVRGTAIGYDWCRFNMDRVNEWFQFLHDGIKENDPDAVTHFKIFPRIITDESGKRDHGIDIEYITNMTEFAGNDITIRKRLYNATEPEWWEDNYAYEWREVAMMYGMLSSFAPDKINFNSESHFLSTNTYADINMSPKYVNSVYWLSTILGANANMTWWWPRYGDGSIEPRLLESKDQGRTFAASAAMMPVVANQITQTFFDLNSVSNEISKFQRQEMPIRVFYSETANICDADQINRVFDVLEPMYFEGVPIGFATQGVIEKYEDTFNEIVIYKTPNVTDAEFDALQKYLDNGGTIIMDKESLVKDQYQKPREARLKQSKGQLIVLDNSTAENMALKAMELLPEDAKPAVTITEENGLTQKGCLWRVAEGNNDQNKVVTIVNMGKNDATLNISGSNITNMLTGEKLSNTIVLETEGTLLLSVDVDEVSDKPSDEDKPIVPPLDDEDDDNDDDDTPSSNGSSSSTTQPEKVKEIMLGEVKAQITADSQQNYDKLKKTIETSKEFTMLEDQNTTMVITVDKKDQKFEKPVTITADLSKYEIKDPSKLTFIKYEVAADGKVNIIKIGGTYNKETEQLTAWVEQTGKYAVVEAKELTQIEMKIGQAAIKVNTDRIQNDVMPQVINGQTMVPLRFVSEHFGADIKWNNLKKEVTIILGGQTIKVNASHGMVINNNRTLVPIRLIAEKLGGYVLWIGDTKEIIIVK